jgi:hypothetical protein
MLKNVHVQAPDSDAALSESLMKETVAASCYLGKCLGVKLVADG